MKRISEKPAFAAIDIGSNAIRLFIGRDHSGQTESLVDLRLPLRLGNDSFTKNAISSSAAKRLIEIMSHFRSYCRHHEAQKIRAVATSALRDASNQVEIVRQVWQATGIVIEVIDGLEEARLVHQAVRRSFHLSRQAALILDMGGGSLEVIHSRNGRIKELASLNLGTVRLLKTVGPEAPYRAYARAVQRELVKAFDRPIQLDAIIQEDLLIATGGNARAIGRLHRHLNRAYAAHSVPIDDIERIAEMLFSLSVRERARRLNLKPDRVDVILPAVAIVLESMRGLNFSAVRLPNVGLKNGIFWQMTRPQSLNLRTRSLS